MGGGGWNPNFLILKVPRPFIVGLSFLQCKLGGRFDIFDHFSVQETDKRRMHPSRCAWEVRFYKRRGGGCGWEDVGIYGSSTKARKK